MPLVTDRSVFLAMPKTGTTWVRAAYKALGLAYTTVEPYHAHELPGPRAPPAQRRPITWTVARDPHDWLASYYANLRAPDKAVGVAAIDTLRLCSGESFDAFIRDYARLLPGYVEDLFGLYAARADLVGTTGALAAAVELALTMSGEAEGLDFARLEHVPRANVSRYEKPTWTPELRALVDART